MSLTTNYTIERQGNDHVFVNVNIINNTTQYLPAVINFKTSDPIVENPKDYHLTIARFLVNTDIVPIFVFPNDNSMTVCLRYAGIDYVQPLVYVPYYPTPTLGAPDYGIYSYQLFIDMINVAFSKATLALVTANPGLVTTPPFLTFDSSNELITFNYETRYLSNNVAPIQIFMSAPLFLLFDNVKIIFNGLNQVNGKDYQLIVENTGNNYVTALLPPTYFPAGVETPVTAPLGAPVGGWTMRQETRNLFMWNDLRSIVFRTTAPVSSEFLPSNVDITNGQITDNYQKILTDFEISLEPGSFPRGYQQYAAQLYRKIDMTSSTPLKRIDLNIGWSNKLGYVRDLYIAPKDTVSCKILLIHKNLVS